MVKKDLENNILYVEQGAEHPALYSRALRMGEFNFISGKKLEDSIACGAKFRYRQPDQKVIVIPEHTGFFG